MPDNLEQTAIKWHPGFYGAAELEFSADKNNLEFEREVTVQPRTLHWLQSP